MWTNLVKTVENYPTDPKKYSNRNSLGDLITASYFIVRANEGV